MPINDVTPQGGKPSPEPKQDLMQQEIEELLKNMEGLDVDHVDLTMDPEYRVNVLAGHRMECVRLASTTLLQAAANKVLNDRLYDQLVVQAKALKMQVAMIDRDCPAAKALCLEMMRVTAQDAAKQMERTKPADIGPGY